MKNTKNFIAGSVFGSMLICGSATALTLTFVDNMTSSLPPEQEGVYSLQIQPVTDTAVACLHQTR